MAGEPSVRSKVDSAAGGTGANLTLTAPAGIIAADTGIAVIYKEASGAITKVDTNWELIDWGLSNGAAATGYTAAITSGTQPAWLYVYVYTGHGAIPTSWQFNFASTWRGGWTAAIQDTTGLDGVRSDVDPGVGTDWRWAVDDLQLAINAATTQAITPAVTLTYLASTLALMIIGHWNGWASGIDWSNFPGSTPQQANVNREIAAATAPQATAGTLPAVTVDTGRNGSLIAGIFSFKPVASGGTTVPVSVSGSTTPTGALAKQAAKTPTGTTTPTGLLLKLTGKRPSGATTPTGALTKAAAKLLAGGTTPTGILARQLNRALAGQSTPTSTLAKQATKTLTGSTTPTGVVATTLVRLIALAGSTTPVGALLRQVSKLAAGTTTPTGALTRRISKPLAGSSTPTSNLVASLVRLISLAGQSTPAGTLAKEIHRTVAGSTTPTAAVTKRTSKALAGASSPLGAVLKLVSRLLAGSTTPGGSVTTVGSGDDRNITVTTSLADRAFTAALEARRWTAVR